MVGYFRNFIKDFAKIAGPLYELLQKDVPFKMTDERIASFQELQKALTECPGLANPHHSWPYVLDTDASTTAIGACLMQLDVGNALYTCLQTLLNWKNFYREIRPQATSMVMEDR
ncbi:putative polyprotein [Gregarina niphandrodes]|uniref:Polyprotein n=1 Tax=Gregarina niphandrodes TaxID=110365 RepID=A0A023AVC7_GRENI|nr:putative polyprotein [Gregarina niphandrodes]EZG42739.1 putative polyprotein [Gregarina niphandrodes]|eukprot:XP_011133983.1 putative polyprotein [Gregarina niphandrodes]